MFQGSLVCSWFCGPVVQKRYPSHPMETAKPMQAQVEIASILIPRSKIRRGNPAPHELFGRQTSTGLLVQMEQPLLSVVPGVSPGPVSEPKILCLHSLCSVSWHYRRAGNKFTGHPGSPPAATAGCSLAAAAGTGAWRQLHLCWPDGAVFHPSPPSPENQVLFPTCRGQFFLGLGKLTVVSQHSPCYNGPMCVFTCWGT